RALGSERDSAKEEPGQKSSRHTPCAVRSTTHRQRSCNSAGGTRSVPATLAHGSPFQRRKPHSPTRHAMASVMMLHWGHSGYVHFAVIGILRFGTELTNDYKPPTEITSPPESRAICSSSWRLPVSFLNSSVSGSMAQPVSRRPTSLPSAAVTTTSARYAP